jgi:hypothetical protein
MDYVDLNFDGFSSILIPLRRIYLVWYAIFPPFKRTALCIASDQVHMRVHVQDIAQQLM